MNATTTTQLISKEELIIHWQGHRMLTRKLIEAFPEKELFNYTIGGMRSFSQMAMELLAIAGPGLEEIVTGSSKELKEHFEGISQKDQLLALWDSETERINNFWSQIPLSKFSERITLFGMYPGSVWSSIFYFIDNEIHHRGQGYVYLRSLGIEPPAFWDRP